MSMTSQIHTSGLGGRRGNSGARAHVYVWQLSVSGWNSPIETGDRVETNTGVWSAQYAITGNVGIRVFDAGPAGGGIEKATPVSGSVAYDSLIYLSYLFEAIGADPNAFVSILDLTANPVSELGEFDTGTATPMAVQATGNTMYVGTESIPSRSRYFQPFISVADQFDGGTC